MLSAAHRICVSPSRSRAFTLVELLVVVGIIALLISILMPALSTVRQSANSVKCEANLRSIALGALSHAADHKGYMPLCGYVFTLSSGNGQGCTPTGLYDQAMQKYSYFTDGTQPRPMDFPGSLAPYLGQKVRTDNRTDLEADLNSGVVAKYFHCPCDRSDGSPGYALADAAGPYVGPSFTASYAYNEAILGIANTGDGSGTTVARLRGKLTDVRKPAQTFIMTDSTNLRGGGFASLGLFLFFNHAGHQTLGDVYSNNNCGSSANFDKLRHRGRINISFCDGHVDSRRISQTDLSNVCLSD